MVGTKSPPRTRANPIKVNGSFPGASTKTRIPAVNAARPKRKILTGKGFLFATAGAGLAIGAEPEVNPEGADLGAAGFVTESGFFFARGLVLPVRTGFGD